mmetsp:Transcript_4056/g.11857  ORF Transcript_4056/g.11857 Transcript_4056/m.11857 type:complete len:213 (-) Transcript_4056:1186-1824(-)
MPSWNAASHFVGSTSHSRLAGQVRRLFISTAGSPRRTTSPLSRMHFTFQQTRPSSGPKLTAMMPASLGQDASSMGHPLRAASMFLQASLDQATAACAVLGTGGMEKLSSRSEPLRCLGVLLMTAPYWQSPTAKTQPPAHTWEGLSPLPLKQTWRCVFVRIQPPPPGPREETVDCGMNRFLGDTPCRTYVMSAWAGRPTCCQNSLLSGSYFTS